MTAETLLGLYAERRLSPVEALHAIHARIDRLNPSLNAFALRDPAAAERSARDSEARWAAGRPLGLLDGVPCTVKDLVDLAGFPTRRGSLATGPEPVAEDAPAVVGLKAAGAVILGKTTTTEFGWKSPGDCPLHGTTRNPWNPAFSTGGSSSGAGAAAAAGFGPLHIGTDAGGSIRIPAAWCGLVGLKPTYGRVPVWPAGAFASVAVTGPMARSVRDAALMLSAMARFDMRDPFCLGEPARDWRDGIEDGVGGLRVALLTHPGFEAPADDAALEAVTHAAGLLEQAGATVEAADADLPDTRHIFGRVWGVALARLVEGFAPDQRALLDPGLRRVAGASAGMSAIEFLDAEALRITAAHRMARFHQRFDLVLCPTVPGPPPLADAVLDDPHTALWAAWAPWTFAFNLTRQPAITVPIGLDEAGLPRAVQLAAAQHRDDLVLRAARVVERATSPIAPKLG